MGTRADYSHQSDIDGIDEVNERKEMNEKRAIVIGDMHADWPATRRILTRYLEDPANSGVTYILQCGDLGYWPQLRPKFIPALSNLLAEYGVIMYWADGNHENHEALDRLLGPYHAVDEAGLVMHVKRGEVLNILGQNIMFFGGAVSVDRFRRLPGHDYFYREIQSEAEWAKAYAQQDVDVVIAHDVPDLSRPWYTKRDQNFWPADVIGESQVLRSRLSHLSETLKPRLWFAGHHHERQTTVVDGTRYEVLNCNGSPFDEWAGVFDLAAPAGEPNVMQLGEDASKLNDWASNPSDEEVLWG